MYNIIVQGTQSKKLIAYIERVYAYLGLYKTDAWVDVSIVKECSGGAGGYCNGDEDIVDVEIARNDYVGKIPMKNLMINIAHEMIHARQIATGRLVNKGFVFRTEEDGSQTMTTKHIFEGQEYIGVAYRDQPWEIEAYKLEETVYEVCK
jgi:hypothetical protein